MSVIAYHSGLGWVKFGFVGVDVFFVISGYLIGTLVYKEIRGGSFTLAKFYGRRANRILPALFGLLLFSYVAGVLLLSPLELRGLSSSAMATIASGSNFFFLRRATGYFEAGAALHPLLMTWSLGVEEQFYFCFPILMLILRGWRWQVQFWTIGCLAAASLVISIWVAHHNPGFSFYMLPARAWELGAGILLALFEANCIHTKSRFTPFGAHIASLLGLAMIGIAVSIVGGFAHVRGYSILMAVAGTVLVIAARDGVANRALSWKPFVFVGLVSYSWYLWHWPLLSFARISAGSEEGLSTVVSVGIGFLSFACAVLSYFFVEQPFRKPAIQTKRLLWRYGALSAGMMLVAVIFFDTNGLPQRLREAERLDIASEGLARDPCMVEGPIATLPLRAPCVTHEGGRAVALIGDSHAAALGGTLRQIGRDHGYRVLEFTKAYCPPLGGELARTVNGEPSLVNDCVQFNRQSLAYIVSDPNIRIVIAGAFWADPLRREGNGEFYVDQGHDSETITPEQSRTALERGLDAMLVELSKTDKTIYLVQDNPEIEFNPLIRMRRRLIGPRRALARVVAPDAGLETGDYAKEPSSPANDEARAMIARLCARYPNVHLIDLQAALCRDGFCRFANGNQTLYSDNAHLTELGAEIALEGWQLP